MAETSITKRAIRNAAIIALIIAGIGLYQGEAFITAAMTFVFSWVVVGGALWLSYKLTTPKNSDTKQSQDKQP